MNSWSHLPNAAHIDHVLESLKQHSGEWAAAWHGGRDVAHVAALNAVYNAARRAAWDAAWRAVRGAVWNAGRDAAWVRVGMRLIMRLGMRF